MFCSWDKLLVANDDVALTNQFDQHSSILNIERCVIAYEIMVKITLFMHFTCDF